MNALMGGVKVKCQLPSHFHQPKGCLNGARSSP